ncbi:MAG: peptidylprolyl isomerase [Planctomycetota bacterium]|jgi:hypothetical protein
MIRFLLPLALLCACSSDDPQPRPNVRGPGEPRRVLIDRIFITYRGNPAGVDARRDLDEARRLARRLLKRARAGEDFAQLRDGYSDDRATGAEKANGPYIFMNYGEKIAPTLMHVPRLVRENMGRRLGDVAFAMQRGDIAIVEHDITDYPAGFEIILCKRRDDRTQAEVEKDLKKG